MNTDNPIPLIYQSGYLTIKEYDKEFRNYMLGFPNEEVKYGFLGFLLPFYTTLPGEERGFYIGKFVQELRQGNIDAFMTRLRAFFADFPDRTTLSSRVLSRFQTHGTVCRCRST